jgi:hypothetical protein
MASKIACLGVLLVLVYLTFLHFFKRHSELDQVKWDMLTITPGDYTMQMEITKKMYDYYIQHVHCRHPNDPVAVRLKEYIKTNLEIELNQKLKEIKNKPKLVEQEGEDEGDMNIQEVRIADIVFAFNNDQLIKLLKQRGTFIMQQKYDKVAETEKKIMAYKEANIEDLIRPVDAFITFEEEDGKIVAEEFEPNFNFWGTKEPSQKIFLDDELVLVEATEPTNIIWENRHFTPSETLQRSLKALLCIIILLIISFVTIYFTKS